MSVRVQKRHICEKQYIWNLATCSCENSKYLPTIINDSVITCDEIIDPEAKSYDEERKTITITFNEKKQPVKYKTSIFDLHFY